MSSSDNFYTAITNKFWWEILLYNTAKKMLWSILHGKPRWNICEKFGLILLVSRHLKNRILKYLNIAYEKITKIGEDVNT